MKHKFIVILNLFEDFKVTMPYYFSNYKEACLYGEYKYRVWSSVKSYKIMALENVEKTMNRFYAL